MGYSKAAEEFFKFLQCLLDLFKRRRSKKQDRIPKTTDESSEPTPSDKLEALRLLSKELQVPRQRKKDGAYVISGDVCWTFQVIFKILRHTDNATEMAEILSFMRKLMSEKVLKRFNCDCPGLPSMIYSLCYCCSGLEDNRTKIFNLTSDIERQIRSTAVEVSRVLLLPVAIRKENREALHDDTRKAVATSLALFGSTIEKFCQSWPEELADQIKKTVEFLPSIIKKTDLTIGTHVRTSASPEKEHYICSKGGYEVIPSEVGQALQGFARQIPKALLVLEGEHHEHWLPTFQSLCGTRPPGNLAGPMCRLWKRLVITSIDEGFKFVDEIIRSTFDIISTKIESYATPGGEDNNEAEIIMGCLFDFLHQCCSWESRHFGVYWNTQVKPIIEAYKAKRQIDLGKTGGPVHEYLNKIIECINDSFSFYQKSGASQGIKEIKPPQIDPADSLLGYP